MQTYQLHRGQGLDGLERATICRRELLPFEVRIRVHAAALNYRDLILARGGTRDRPPLVPLSDGAGEVVEIGREVTQVALGDRVTAAFYPDWQDGLPTEASTAQGLGGGGAGWLTQQLVLPEWALVKLPAHLSYREGATLTCAGTAAWHALFELLRLRPGGTVLLQGTGGVSLWALQLAKAVGLRVIITSSDDAKLEAARRLGADATVNYRSHPAWSDEVRRLTDGAGADLVVEVGGRGTLTQSLRSTRIAGAVAVVGGVSGFGGELEPWALIDGALKLLGVLVGSRAMTDRLARFTELHGIRPVLDRVFGFEQAREAFAWLEGGRHMGKVVIDTTVPAL